MPQRAVRDENRAKLDDGLLRTVKGHQFNAPPSILQRFQFQVDARRTLELHIETGCCSMDSNVGSRATCLRFGLCLSQGVAKSSYVTLAVGWASVWRPLDLSKMRRVRLGRRRLWNEQVLAISRGWHCSATPCVTGEWRDARSELPRARPYRYLYGAAELHSWPHVRMRV